jgi:hypothetical protein
VSGCFRPISCLSSDRMARFGLPAPAQPERRPEGDIMPIGVVLIRSSTRRRVAALRRPCPGLRAERSAQGLLRATPIGVLGVLAMLASPACGGAASLRVTTEAGALGGRLDRGVAIFLGIPYADTTAGANRWRPPQPVKPWSGVRDATRFGDNCQQGPPYLPPSGSPWTAEYMPTGRTSEACLFLNIWSPAGKAAGLRPVMCGSMAAVSAADQARCRSIMARCWRDAASLS